MTKRIYRVSKRGMGERRLKRLWSREGFSFRECEGLARGGYIVAGERGRKCAARLMNDGVLLPLGY